jgi:hypothetical protein
VRIAWQARDWPTANSLQIALIAWARAGLPRRWLFPRSASPQRRQIRNLAVSPERLGHILSRQGGPGRLPYFQEALGLYERIGGRQEQANLANSNAYLTVPGLGDLGQAEH